MTRPVINARLRLLVLVTIYAAWMFVAANVVVFPLAINFAGELFVPLVLAAMIGPILGRIWLHSRLPTAARSANWYLATVVSLTEIAAGAAALVGAVVGFQNNNWSCELFLGSL